MACLHPLVVHHPYTGQSLIVPCGKCVGCIRRRQNDWIVRLTEEQKVSFRTFFFTLTYDEDSIPKDIDTGTNVLYPRDIQLFMKRLRKQLDVLGIKVRYFICGEYGPKTKRPHYHGLFFFKQDIMLCDLRRYMDFAWNLGWISLSKVTEARIAYCAKYMTFSSRLSGVYKLHKPFVRTSIRLGYDYIPRMSFYHKNLLDNFDNNGLYYVTKQGYKLALPRYYQDRIFSDAEKAKIAYQKQTFAKARFEQSQRDEYEISRQLKLIYYERGKESFNRSYFKRIVTDVSDSLRNVEKERQEFVKLSKCYYL